MCDSDFTQAPVHICSVQVQLVKSASGKNSKKNSKTRPFPVTSPAPPAALKALNTLVQLGPEGDAGHDNTGH